LINFIRHRAPSCRYILSVCTGAFLLQAAGLLRNKRATTHWKSLRRLRACGDVTVIEERFVRDGNIWTASGISAGIDLALAFVAELAGEDMAGKVQQLAAEYYPQQRIYGIASRIPEAPGYLEGLQGNPSRDSA
jgi:transcriptional regulator GlxA family with amidase domain